MQRLDDSKEFWGGFAILFRFLPGIWVEDVDINCRILALGFIFLPTYQDLFYTFYINRVPHQLHHTFYIYTTCIRATTVYSCNTMNSLTAMAPIRVASLPKPYLCLAVRGYTSTAATTGLRSASLIASKKHHQLTSKRYVASTPTGHNKEYFPPPKADQIKEVVSSWSHPV